MSESSGPIIDRVLINVLETMAFIFADPWEEIEVEELAPWLAVRLRFHGHGEGQVVLATTNRCARMLRAEVLGQDADEVTDAAAEDTVRELLNVICGNILTELYGSVPVFNLEVPEIRPAECDEIAGLAESPESGKVFIDGEPIIVALQPA
ncbi:MAG: hypothetical protein GC168_11275 [Candidatus Hydrogenedens sp.]|nr:hypothetical protein [Candidatus Hydrogenedens sp.]